MGCRSHVGNRISWFDLASDWRGERSLEERGQGAEADGGGCFFHALRTRLVTTHWVPHRGGAAFSKAGFLVTSAQAPSTRRRPALEPSSCRVRPGAPHRLLRCALGGAGRSACRVIQGRRGDALTACRGGRPPLPAGDSALSASAEATVWPARRNRSPLRGLRERWAPSTPTDS